MLYIHCASMIVILVQQILTSYHGIVIIPIIKVECHRTLTNIDCQSLIYEEDSVGLTGPRGGAVPA